MNILDSGLCYFSVPPSIFQNRSKTSLIRHLRQLKDDTPVGPAFVVPRYIQWEHLSYASAKLLLGCYSRNDNGEIISTPGDLSSLANLSHTVFPRTVAALVDANFIKVQYERKSNQRLMRVILLDPYGSGISLREMAEGLKAEYSAHDIFYWYNKFLVRREQDGLIRKPVPSSEQKHPFSIDLQHTCSCPFCIPAVSALSSKERRCFNLSIWPSTEPNEWEDKWFCHNCKRHGDCWALFKRLRSKASREWNRPRLENTNGDTNGENGNTNEQLIDDGTLIPF